MSKTKAIVVRHGKTEWNKQKRIQGQTETDLLEEAVGEIKKLAKELKNHNVKGIYTSTLRRAVQTGEIIAEELGSKVLGSFDELRERNYGPIEGRHLDEILVEFGDDFFDQDPEGVEKSEEVRERTVRKIIEISKEHPDETIVVVTHGGNIRRLMSEIEKDSLSRIPNAAPFIFEVENGEIKFISESLS